MTTTVTKFPRPIPRNRPDPAKKGWILDIGCGTKKFTHPLAIGMDVQDLPGVDVVHDWDEFPWPFEDDSMLTIIASHVIEHVSPIRGHFLDWMNECWRILKKGGKLAIVTPFGGSEFYYRDPTHCNGCTHETSLYFDPTHPSEAYSFYEPAPFWIRQNDFMVEGNLEWVLEKLADKGDYHADGKIHWPPPEGWRYAKGWQ